MNITSPAYASSVYQGSSLSNPHEVGASAALRPSNGLSEKIFSSQHDKVSISPEAQQAGSLKQSGRVPSRANSQEPNEKNVSEQSEKNASNQKLDEQELLELDKLKQRDIEVRQHEQAHLAVAGQYAAGGASFSYERGPDGAKYAVAGEVPIDISKESSPAATILKMQTVKRAALAPASPSSADRMIAAHADAKAAQARLELQEEQNKETQEHLSAELTETSPAATKQNHDNENQSSSSQPDLVSRKTFEMISTYNDIAASTI